MAGSGSARVAAHLLRRSLTNRLLGILARRTNAITAAAVAVAPALLLALPTVGTQGAGARMSGLEIAIVNEDVSVVQSTGTISLGDGVVDRLVASDAYTWVTANPDAARGGSADGRFLATVRIRGAFTEQALAGGENAALAEVKIEASQLLPQVAPELGNAVVDAVIAELSEAGTAAGGSLPGAAAAESPRDRLIAGLNAARQSNAMLEVKLQGLEKSLVSANAASGRSDESLRALRSARSAAASAAETARSAASALAGRTAAAADSYRSTRNILISELQIQGFSPSQQNHVMAIYDRLAPSIGAAQDTAANANSGLTGLTTSLNVLQSRITEAIEGGASQSAVKALLKTVREAHSASATLDKAFGQAVTLAEGLDPSGAPRTLADRLEVTPETGTPRDSIDAGRLAGLAAFALALGALLIAPFSARLGRPLVVDPATGMPLGADLVRPLLLAGAQGLAVGVVLSLGLHASPLSAVLATATAMLIACALTAALTALVLWFGVTGLYVGVGTGLIGWFLTAGSQPVSSLTAPLNWLAEMLPTQWASTSLSYFALGQPFHGFGHVGLPLACLLGLGVASVVLGEQAHHSRRGWTATRLAEALSNDS